MKDKVAVIMGSSSDADVMKAAVTVLEQFDVECEYMVVSAHRSPDWMYEYARNAENRSIKIIIAGAGGAAHLPGMMAALTTLPVIGVPIRSSNSIDGWDSLLSIVQMPNDVPVATVAINGAHNAAILAVQMLAISNGELKAKLMEQKQKNQEKVTRQNELLGNKNN
jgi:5-(carboxyamino)imidazole ribonucleotide mutase